MDEEKEVINFINRGGQEPESQGLVNTKNFENMVATLMTAMNELWRLIESKKSFRVELNYNAKTLNSEYRLYLIKDDASLDRANQEARSDLYQNLHL